MHALIRWPNLSGGRHIIKWRQQHYKWLPPDKNIFLTWHHPPSVISCVKVQCFIAFRHSRMFVLSFVFFLLLKKTNKLTRNDTCTHRFPIAFFKQYLNLVNFFSEMNNLSHVFLMKDGGGLWR